eukprot:1157652-Pelagomonas_calceolata.AAC.18
MTPIRKCVQFLPRNRNWGVPEQILQAQRYKDHTRIHILTYTHRIEPDGQQPRVLVHGRRCTRDLLVPTSEKCGYKDAAEAMGVNEGVIYVIDVPVRCTCVAGVIGVGLATKNSPEFEHRGATMTGWIYGGAAAKKHCARVADRVDY